MAEGTNPKKIKILINLTEFAITNLESRLIFPYCGYGKSC